MPDRDQKVCPKEHTKGKHILNKDEINELINIIEECPTTKKEGKKENYRKKDENYQNKEEILKNKDETHTNKQKIKLKFEKHQQELVPSEQEDSYETEKTFLSMRKFI